VRMDVAVVVAVVVFVVVDGVAVEMVTTTAGVIMTLIRR